MHESTNPFVDDPEGAEVDKLMDQGLTGAEARARVYGPAAPESEPVRDVDSGTRTRIPRPKISRSRLSSREKLGADEPPPHIRQQIEEIPPAVSPEEAAEGQKLGKEILDRLRGS